MRYLVTGSSGFAAHHLIQELVKRGHDVLGLDIKNGEDIRDYERVRTLIETARPQRIFHLAALTYIPESFNDPHRAIDINIKGTLNILEAVRNSGTKARIMIAGTSDEYGDSLTFETCVLKPKSPYAVTKVAADLLAQTYKDLDIIVTRAFSHTGPGKPEFNAESSWAKQITEIEDGVRDKLYHGNLQAVRNFTDVRDMVKAYIEAIELPPGVYNICSEQNVTMQEVLDTLVKNARCEIKTEVDEKLYRTYDFDYKNPNCDKFKVMTEWNPEISLDKTLSDLLDYWRTV